MKQAQENADNRMPPGVPYIIGSEAAERFSYYGMNSILVPFMTHYLLTSSGAIDRRSRRAFVASVITSPPRTISACVRLIGASISTGLSSSSAAIPPSSPALTAKTRQKSECPISRR